MTRLDEFQLPKVNTINKYVRAYISGLNQHIPCLHLPTLKLNELQLPRLLAICSLGAQLRSERQNANKLHIASMRFLKQVSLILCSPLRFKILDGKLANEIRDSTWISQTILLNMIYAAWSGEVAFFRNTLTLHAVLANVFLYGLPH